MKRIVIAAVVVMLGASGCQSVLRFTPIGSGGDFEVRAKPDPKEAGVFVDIDANNRKRIVIDQEPIYARPHPNDNGKKQVKWKLDNNYVFPSDINRAIEFCLEKDFVLKRCLRPVMPRPDCRLTGNRRIIFCDYDAPAQDVRYWYTIRVVDGNIELDLDPSVMN
jgi:hypothetical protein